MSYRALLLGVRDELRDTLELSKEECEITIDGQPFPACGDRFIAIHDAGSTTQETESLDESYSVDVTVTFRLPKTPVDRETAVLLATTVDGFYKLCDAVKATVSGDVHADSILNRWNRIIGIAANGFCEPLRYRGASRPQPRGGNWFWSKGERRAGVSKTLFFREARRVQDMTTQQ